MRVFFGHPKTWDEELINEAVKELAVDMSASFEKAVTVVPGRDDFQQNIASEGNFNGWCRSITRRTDQYGKRVYDVVVIPKTAGGIGKATAMIAQDALRAGMPVVQVEWLEAGGLEALPVTAVDAVDTEDYFTGWQLVIGPDPRT